ncbi:hypothetical protein DLAC_08033 [Tieghemostelium lacteum]|uniref:AP complex mu/sigma subunit domain-containing protein n=1 Tax=Tieghemostelium lacteum TaxID=361077 RepID=A0A151ZB15_TIELA|nr:hypothetical protein DLAC_08033 [Tieghemostelium lacteum]|eukprot:KYQ91126.1 hypothetical protein DLAC_08033 [Tieghemostelium lacteum]
MNLLPDIYQVKAIIILDKNGNRICSNFYDLDLKEFKTEKDKREFEKVLYNKSKSSNCELELIEQLLVVGNKTGDIMVFVIGLQSGNEIALLDVLTTVMSCIKKICSQPGSLTTEDSSNVTISKKSLLNDFSTLKLYLDEIISDGIIFELEDDTIFSRIPLPDQTIVNAIEMAKEKISYFTSSR